jgi:hypothetical protein
MTSRILTPVGCFLLFTSRIRFSQEGPLVAGWAWLEVLLVVQEDEFFARSKHGTIWGTVYFQIGESEFFPGQGWD